ncbi:MAG: response regulator [Thermoguttaceae bacterium]
MQGKWAFSVRYGFAVASVAAALMLRLWLDPILGNQLQFVVFLLAIALVVWRAGRGPAIVALAMSVLVTDYFLIEPRYSLGSGGIAYFVGLVLFVCAGAAVILAAELRGAHLAYRQMEAYNQELLALKERLEQEITERQRTEAERNELLQHLQTERDRLLASEEKLKSLNDTLEQQVLERTAVAEQRSVQLRILASELVQAEERERRRLAKVLHDHLQQLLVAARIKISTASRRAADAALVRMLEQADDVLDQAVAESRSLAVELSPPVLYEAGLSAALEWLGRQVEEKHGLHVEVTAASTAEPADDATRLFLFQAVRELLLNVVKHAHTEQARVELTSLDDSWLRVTVADSGVGIALNVTTNLRAGSGLGLFSIRERLKVLGGRFAIDANPGGGTRVTIEVADRRACLAPVGHEAEQPALALPEPSVTPSGDGRRRKTRVVLADDHPVLRQGLAGLLRDHSEIDVVGEAADGRQAVEVALRTHPDVILMDITMPLLNGIEATRRILDAIPSVRVIGLSMHAEADMATAMRKAGAVAYLSKDTATESLLATILAQP